MAKGKDLSDEQKNDRCISIFKNGSLTKEDYTNLWVELISVSERRKGVNPSSSQ